MIIVSEIKIVVVLGRKTGSETLLRAVTKKYPLAFVPDRHSSAADVPEPHRSWPKVGVVREPVGRLWSLYLFLRQWHGVAECPFEEWLVTEQIARESQWILLRPDLGTEIYQFTDQAAIYGRLGVEVPPENEWANHDYSRGKPVNELSETGVEHIKQYFRWDAEQTRGC
jgi:hypothetical protein